MTAPAASRAPEAPEGLRMRARDWARAYRDPAVPETTWGGELDRAIADDVRAAVVRRVRAENRRALAAGIAVTAGAVALAVALLLGLRLVIALPPIPFALLVAAVTLGVTAVAARWFRRIHAGARYRARVLEVHRAIATDTHAQARAALASRRAA